MKLKKGDQVKIVKGRDKGKIGNISRVLAESGAIVIDTLNLYKKRVRPKQQGKKGETVLVARPLSASNVMLVCQSCKRPARAGFRFEGNAKIRYCKKCKAGT